VEWRDLDWVAVRSNRGHLAHVLRMKKYQPTLRRLQMAGNPLSDFLYITNRIWMGTPSARLLVRISLAWRWRPSTRLLRADF
jgi:hypothetical protein